MELIGSGNLARGAARGAPSEIASMATPKGRRKGTLKHASHRQRDVVPLTGTAIQHSLYPMRIVNAAAQRAVLVVVVDADNKCFAGPETISQLHRFVVVADDARAFGAEKRSACAVR